MAGEGEGEVHNINGEQPRIGGGNRRGRGGRGGGRGRGGVEEIQNPLDVPSLMKIQYLQWKTSHPPSFQIFMD